MNSSVRCAGCSTPSVCRGAGACVEDSPALVLAVGRLVAGPGVKPQPEMEQYRESIPA